MTRSFTLCATLLCIAAAFVSGSATRAGAQAPLRSTVFPLDSARSRRVGATNTQRSIVDTVTATLSKLELHDTTVPEGAWSHAPHRHAHEEVIVVRSGVLEVLQGTVTRIAPVGSVVFMASNELHGLHNPGPGPATYLVVRMDPHDLPPDAPAATVSPAPRPD